MKQKSLLMFTVILVVFSIPRFACSTEQKYCDIRAAILGSVAQERDKGMSKAKVKKIFGKKHAGLFGYIDLVYDQMKDMSPKEVEALVKYACSKE